MSSADVIVVFLAEYLPYFVAGFFVLFVFLRARARKERIILLAQGFAAALAARGLVEVIRFFVHRPRPFVADPSLVPLISETSFSFPSGHASFFFALSAVAYAHDRRSGWVFFALSALVSLARVAAGVHYLSDIVGGAILGIAVGYSVVRIRRALMAMGESKRESRD